MPKIIQTGALAEKIGFKLGDEMVSLGGYKFVDELDYLYFDARTRFKAVVNRGGEEIELDVKKRADESLELIFDGEMKPYRCKNKCVFCFVDQLPCGMRDTLYVKDDDYRYSFISGSYVTMTNVGEEEIERIIRLKLSPLYISVHAYDDDIRKKLVRNPKTRDLINVMRRLGKSGIKMHTQIVVVPGLNDGKTLKDSIRGLHSVEGVETVAVVPVGLTCHRQKLSDVKPVSEAEAAATVDAVEKLNAEFGGFCWCSDEYYLRAKRTVPQYEYYGGFEQIENGVGLLADWKDNLEFALSEVGKTDLYGKACFITGVSFAPVLLSQKALLEDKLGLKVSVAAIENNYFGKTVTVAGLITSDDITKQCKDFDCDVFVISDNMLREFSDMFLDNVSLEETQKALGKPIIVVAHNGADTPQKLIEFFRRENAVIHNNKKRKI